MKTQLEKLLDSFDGFAEFQKKAGSYWIYAPEIDVIKMAEFFKKNIARLNTITGIPLPEGETELIYHFTIENTIVNIKTQTKNGEIPSITPILMGASWIEREIHDFFSVTFTGHPNPARLLLPPHLQQGLYRELGGAAGKALREKA